MLATIPVTMRSWFTLDSVVLVIGITALGAVGEYALHTLLTHAISPAEYGDFSIAYAVVLTVGAGVVLGADRTIMKFLPIYIQARDFSRMSGFVLMFTAAPVLLAVVLALGVVITHLMLDMEGDYFFHTPEGHPVSIAIWLVPIYALSRFSGGVLNAAKRPVLSAVNSRVAIPLAAAVVVVGLMVNGYDVKPAHILGAFALAFFLTILATLFLLPPGVKVWHSNRTFQPQAWLALSIPIMAIELVWKVNGYTGAFMLELLGKVEADVGLFAASQMAGYLVMIPFLGVAAVVLPRLSPIAIGEEHHEARQALFGKTTRHLALLSCAVAVPLIVYRDAVLGMFGPEYYEASNVLLLIAISFLIICTFGIASPFLQFCGDERLVLGVVLCATVFDFLLAAMLIPYWGAEGAAVAFLARGVLVEATMLFLIWRLQGLVPFFTRVPAALKPALA